MVRNASIYLILVIISTATCFNHNRSKSRSDERIFECSGVLTGSSLYYNVIKPNTLVLKQEDTNDSLNFTYGLDGSYSYAHISLNVFL